MPHALPLQQASAARILVAITFHFNARRLGYLAEVLRALSEYPVSALDVVILTNSFDPRQLGPLRRLCADTLADHRCEVRSEGDLVSPWDLTWRHKPIIENTFLGDASGRYTHFIYLEDDIRLTFNNFCYWMQFRELLRGFGLLPAFLRLEWSASAGSFTMSDVFWPVYVPVQAHLLLGDIALLNMPNPYNPCFILDIELAQEYSRSPSFDIATSRTVSPWGIPERAAMGLCLEHVPPPFASRYVVPVSRQTGKACPFASVAHLPNNYADTPQSALGKLRLADLFAGVDDLTDPQIWGATAAVPEGRPEDPLPMSAAALGELRKYFHLVSDHDTILYLDEEQQRICHAPFGVAPLNLVLEWAGARGRLMAVNTTSQVICPLSFVSSNGEIGTRPDTADLDCEIAHYFDNTVSIRFDEMYLGADFGGLALNNKAWCHQWERYRLVRADVFNQLALMRRHAWLCHGDRRIITLADQPFDFGREGPTEASALASTLAAGALEPRRELVFGPVRLRLADRELSIITDDPARNGNAPGQLSISDRTGSEHRFSRFAPIVRYEVHGGDAAFDCLRLSLTSLARHGRYRGLICVASDRPREAVLAYVPAVFHGNITVEPIPVGRTPSDGGDPEVDVLTSHQPVLLCTPDTLFTSRIVDGLIDLLLDRRVIASVEDEPISSSGGRQDGVVRFQSETTPHDDRSIAGAMQAYLDDLDCPEPRKDRGEGADPVERFVRPAATGGCIVILGDFDAPARAVAAAVHSRATVYHIEHRQRFPREVLADDPTVHGNPGSAGADGSVKLPNVIRLRGDSPREFVGWQREIDGLFITGISLNPQLRTNLAFWSRFVRPGGVVCGIGHDDPASDVRFEVCLLAETLGAKLEAVGDVWSVELPEGDD